MFCFPFPIIALPLHGQSLPASADDSAKLLPPYGELPPTFWDQHGTMILIAALALVSGAAVVVWFATRPKSVAPELPAVRARRELNALLNRVEDGVQLSAVSQVLRRYVIVAFELPFGEPTTAEFRQALSQTDKFKPELSSALLDFLDECDQRKFAPPSPGQPMGAAVHALQLVGQCEGRLAKIRDETAPAKSPQPANA